MKLVTAFGPHLYFDNNSSQDLLNSLPNKGLIKKILPVNYFKRSILRPVKKYKPDVLICLGLDENKKIPVFETVAKNEMITIKNPFFRFLVKIYSRFLWLFSRNIRIKNQPHKNKLTILKINKKHKSKIKLHTKVPKLEGIGISKDAGYFVCNYTIWIIEEYLQKNNINCNFYYIHIPQNPTTTQKKIIKDFILSV